AFEDPIAIALEDVPAGVVVEAPAIAAGEKAATITFHNRRAADPVNGVRAKVRGGAAAASASASASFSLTLHCPALPPLELRLIAGAPGGLGTADDLGPDARFAAPASIVGDGHGNLYVADTFNHAIRKIVLATGAVTTLAGWPGRPGFTDGTGAGARFS